MNRSLITNTTKIFYRLSFGLFLLELSLVYINTAGVLLLNNTMMLQLMVSGILGFFHSVHKSSSNSLNEGFSAIYWISNTLIYSAWYNVVVLPPSGFWLIEIVMLSCVIFSDFLASVSGKENEKIAYVNSSRLNILILGSLLFIGKVIVIVLFPQNLYIEHFTGNSTARLFILLISLMGFICLLTTIFKKFKIAMNIKPETLNATSNFLKTIINWIKRFIKFFVSLLSGPMLIVVLLILGFGAVFFIFAFIKTTCDDILRFVEPILIKLAETGKSSITDSVIYYITQITVIVSVLIASIRRQEEII